MIIKATEITSIIRQLFDKKASGTIDLVLHVTV